MNETDLFWKKVSDSTLITEYQSDKKKKKTQISIILCLNVIETDKLSSWIIEKTVNFCCFKIKNIQIQELNMIWKYNVKIWMIIIICV